MGICLQHEDELAEEQVQASHILSQAGFVCWTVLLVYLVACICASGFFNVSSFVQHKGTEAQRHTTRTLLWKNLSMH
jgi:hypothetical protein